ncbi:hypothetical protein AAHK14_05025 [Moraxella sp. K1664]|uniref:hypothetical protein n=1 Tax=Moraxella sp. K1664 TaxID=2780077 RepID=UPI0012E7068D
MSAWLFVSGADMMNQAILYAKMIKIYVIMEFRLCIKSPDNRVYQDISQITMELT